MNTFLLIKIYKKTSRQLMCAVNMLRSEGTKYSVDQTQKKKKNKTDIANISYKVTAIQ